MFAWISIASPIPPSGSSSPTDSAFWLALVTVVFTLANFWSAYFYDRGRRFNYLADRWHALMKMNLEETNFFSPEQTQRYRQFDADKAIKYSQHARIHWGLVEDAIRNDYFFEVYLLKWTKSSFVDCYSDTIQNIIRLHHVWLRDHAGLLFTYKKFRKVLSRRFSRDLRAVDFDFRLIGGAMVAQIRDDAARDTSRITLRWYGKRAVGDFILERLGEVLECANDTDNTGWVVIKRPCRVKSGKAVALRK
jgi:hypothetical protein